MERNFRKTAGASWLKAATIILLFLASIVFGGCAAQYGKLNNSPEITQNLKANPVLPDHTYYYRGRSSDPYAIVGIQQNYELKSSLWKKTELSAPELEQLIERSLSGEGHASFRSEILDPSGNYIGIWFSNQYGATVKMEPDNRTVAIIPNSPYFIGEGAR
jgi:hypothetical protein